MPRCKNCHQMLSSIDKDICPFCGTLKPLEGVSYETEDITKAIDPIKKEFEVTKHKSRKIAFVLCLFLGVFGVHEFYLEKPRRGIAFLIASLIMIVGGGCTLFFTGLIANIFAFLIPYFIVLAFDIFYGVCLLKDKDATDGRGESIL